MGQGCGRSVFTSAHLKSVDETVKGAGLEAAIGLDALGRTLTVVTALTVKAWAASCLERLAGSMDF